MLRRVSGMSGKGVAAVLGWEEIAARTKFKCRDARKGPANSHAVVRLFDAPEDTQPDVCLYRDYHYWCPYCEKVQLFLECKRIPYEIKKVTMFCYGKKEAWFKKIVPSGMLPAVSLQGKIITESDDILDALESVYGPLQQGLGMRAPDVVRHRRRERKIFSAWCQWLCYPSRSAAQEEAAKQHFSLVAREVEENIQGPFMLGSELTIADLVYVPYLERMNASLFYYKGYNLRAEHPLLDRWFSALEKLDCYQGLISDFSTHAHDLPPQMGGCFSNDSDEARKAARAVDEGPFMSSLIGLQVDPEAFPEPEDSVDEAVYRVTKHRNAILSVNPQGPQACDIGLRATMTLLLTGTVPDAMPTAEGKVDKALRYIRDRISVPRDMPLWSGIRLRDALETIAATYGDGRGEEISLRNRYDQNPVPFHQQQDENSSSSNGKRLSSLLFFKSKS